MRLASRRRRLLEALVLAALGALVFAPALPGPFVFDDAHAIVANDSLRALWPPQGWLAQPRDLPTSGRPAMALSFALDRAIAGLAPAAFRITNVAVHVACAWLLVGLARATFRSPRLARRLGAHADGLAFASGALFLVHPLASEVACYATARSESLMAFFYLATLAAALRALRAEPRPAAWGALAIACCALGMASKEVMVSAPLVVPLYARVFFGPAEPGRRRARLALYAGLAATWAVLAALVLARPRGESAGFSLWVSPWLYLLNQCLVLPEYLRLALWPSPLRLDWGVPQPLAFGDVWLGALLLVALLALSLYALWRWPATGFVGVVSFALLAPSSSLVPIASEVGADRRMYLPLALLVPFALALGFQMLSRAGAARLAPWLAGLALVGFAAQSARRAATFADPVVLWQAEVAATPENARARYNLAGALANAGRDAEAAAAKSAALRGELAFYTSILPLQPDRAAALADLAALHVVAGDDARALALYEELLALAPGDRVARRRLELLRARRDGAGGATPE